MNKCQPATVIYVLILKARQHEKDNIYFDNGSISKLVIFPGSVNI
jgi:hypothetical protein